MLVLCGVVCVRVAGDHLQADGKRAHLVVAAQVVIELPLRRPDLLAVLEERRHPVGRLVGRWLAGRPAGAQARGQSLCRRLVAEEGVRVRAPGSPRIDDRVVAGGMAEAAVRVEVVAMKLGRRRRGRDTRAEQRRQSTSKQRRRARTVTPMKRPRRRRRGSQRLSTSGRPSAPSRVRSGECLAAIRVEGASGGSLAPRALPPRRPRPARASECPIHVCVFASVLVRCSARR